MACPTARAASPWLLVRPTHVARQALPGLAGCESSVVSPLLGLLAEPSGRWIDVRMQSHCRNTTASAAHIRKLTSCYYSTSPAAWLFSFTGTRCVMCGGLRVWERVPALAEQGRTVAGESSGRRLGEGVSAEEPRSAVQGSLGWLGSRTLSVKTRVIAAAAVLVVRPCCIGTHGSGGGGWFTGTGPWP